MKILVMSDSHAGRSFMRLAVASIKPDAIIHLGDYYEDGEVIAQENPHIRIHQVPGNCDRFRCDPNLPLFMCYDVCGVRIYMTHGHMHSVKSTRIRLEADARAMKAAAVVYGHTHEAECRQDEGGMWILNPGACGSFSGSVGVIEVADGKILGCSILRHEDF